MIKDAQTKYPINELSRKRWSPRAYVPTPVETVKLQSLFEASRWAPSAGNVQPWNYVIGVFPDETWHQIFQILDDGNKIWAQRAPVLVISVGKKTRGARNADNAWFAYDTGQSVAHLTLEAVNQGLYAHQMAGFDQQGAVQAFDIPEDHQPLTAIAIGYLGDPEVLSEDHKRTELSVRTRKGFHEFVFSGKFGKTTDIF